ncbi:MAG: outer membrane beta-barrel protein [Flavobacteriaceae bacterium]|nr:outer membrane beta-barrel protein [Flavobacteriaceae bacterium]
MKKGILFLFLALGISTASAQLFSFGIKGGVNNNSNGNMSEVSGFIGNLDVKSIEEAGYHFGVFGEINLPLWLYIRPELNYTHTESSYKLDGNKQALEMNKIDVPVLAGLKILHWGRIIAGPVFSYMIDYRSVEL